MIKNNNNPIMAWIEKHTKQNKTLNTIFSVSSFVKLAKNHNKIIDRCCGILSQYVADNKIIAIQGKGH